MPTVSLISRFPNENEQKFEVKKDEIIFEELERQGHTLPHGCLAGSCGSCRIEVLEGAENLSEMSRVEKDTVESIIKTGSIINKNIRLACRAKVLGDVKITLLK